MTRRLLICCLAVSLAVACSRPQGEHGGQTVEAYSPQSGAVGFDIEPLQSGNVSQWMAVYKSQGKTARFRIELGPTKLSRPEGDFQFKSGSGEFIGEPGSDATCFFVDLKNALGAQKLPGKVQRSTNLPFTFVILGENQSRGSAGGFRSRPSGNWTAAKIFFEEGEQEGELFFNFNAVIKKAEFSIKDPDYGDFVLAELAKVL